MSGNAAYVYNVVWLRSQDRYLPYTARGSADLEQRKQRKYIIGSELTSFHLDMGPK